MGARLRTGSIVSRAGWLVAFVAIVSLASLLANALGEQRFPPPEFESGYKMPGVPTPAPRAVFLQYVDIAVLLAALGLAAYLTLVKRSRKWIGLLSLFSLLYFGFYREGCVCAIGSIQNVALAAFSPSYALPLTVGAFFLAPLVVALFFGRSFCAGVCPHGALQDLVLLKPLRMPLWLEEGLSILPFLYLGAGVLLAATGSTFLICRADPFIPIFRLAGPANMVLVGVGFVVLATFVGRPYCRFMCPYGALLKLASICSRWRVTVSPSHCSKCRICDEACPYGAIRTPALEPEPAQLPAGRRRLIGLALLLPALIAAGGLLGSKLSVPLSRLNANVALAEKSLTPGRTIPPTGAPTPESLALGRAELNAPTLMAGAVETRRHFVLGGWILGGWIGLVIGAKLIALSIRPERGDYEPDRGACLGCGRCFVHCPHEKVRRAQIPSIGKRLPGPITPLPVPPKPV